MTFSNPKQIVVLVLIWTAALFAVDRIKNPDRAFFGSERTAAGANITRPQLRLWMNHLCCTGCLTDLEAALGKLAWLGKPMLAAERDLLTQGEADGESAVVEEYRQRVDVDVLDVESVDFMDVIAALRESGFTAQHIEFGGVSHYRIEAELEHVCCNLCARGAREGMDELVTAARARGYFGWLDSISVSKINKVITFYPRFNETVDVAEIVSGIDRLGFAPTSLTLRLED
jgi:hypothetical protein